MNLLWQTHLFLVAVGDDDRTNLKEIPSGHLTSLIVLDPNQEKKTKNTKRSTYFEEIRFVNRQIGNSEFQR